MSASAIHALIAMALILCYTVLTALGHDGNPLIAALGGQALGGLGQAASK